jgi:hypothetical protein
VALGDLHRNYRFCACFLQLLRPLPPETESFEDLSEQIIRSAANSDSQPLPVLSLPEDEFSLELLSTRELELSPSILELKGDYARSTAKYFLDLARATYAQANMYDGQVWEWITANSVFNVKVIGRLNKGKNEIDLGIRGSVAEGFEGQLDVTNWLRTNFSFLFGNLKADLGDELLFEWDCSVRPQVYCGFLEAWLAVRNEVHHWLDKQRQHRSESFITVRCCGHSLGGALSTLCALDLVKRGYTVKLVTWGSPRVGDAQFVSLVQSAVENGRLQIARFVNGLDIVPNLPPEKFGFKHVCKETQLDAWVRAVTVEAVAAHSLTTYATNLANCFRNQVLLVSAVETAAGVATLFQYTSRKVVPFLMAVWQGPGSVCNWLAVNNAIRAMENMAESSKLVHREVIQLQETLRALHDLINEATSELKKLVIEQREQDKVDAVKARLMTLNTASREQAFMDSSHPALTSLRDACNELLLYLQDFVKGFLTLPKEDSCRTRLARQVDVLCIGFLAELQVIDMSGEAKRYNDRRDEIANQLYPCLRDLHKLKAKGVFDASTACVSIIFVVQVLFEGPKPELVMARPRVFVWLCARAHVHRARAH